MKPAAVSTLAVVVLFALAAGVRLYRVTDPLLEFHPVRQYRAAMIARASYLRAHPEAATAASEVAVLNASREPRLEPPVLETLTARLYGVLGGERLFVGRVLSIAAWLVAGLFVYLTAVAWTGTTAALVAPAVFLFTPFGIVASRAFQPDALMTALIAVVVWLVARAGPRLMAAAILAGVAILVKPQAVFFVVAVLLAGLWSVRGAITRGELARVAAATFVPAALYYGYVNAVEPGTFSGRLRPRLVLSIAAWTGWQHHLRLVVGLPGLLVAALGTLLTRRGETSRHVLLALWIGYATYGVTFTYFVATHDYYHLPILVPVALACVVAVSRLAGAIGGPSRRWPVAAVTAVVVTAVVVVGVVKAARVLANDAGRGEAATYERVGRLVGHDTRLVMLAHGYGAGLKYHGHVAGEPWPTAGDLHVNATLGIGTRDLEYWASPHVPAAERYRRWFAPRSPSYFVITDLDSLAGQPDLRRFLDTHFARVAVDPGFLVYDLRRGP